MTQMTYIFHFVYVGVVFFAVRFAVDRLSLQRAALTGFPLLQQANIEYRWRLGEDEKEHLETAI